MDEVNNGFASDSAELDDPDSDYVPDEPLVPNIRRELFRVQNTGNSEEEDDEINEDEVIQTQEKQKTRKRQRNPDEHKQNKAKKLRNSGKSYINRKGNNVDGKNFEHANCHCSKKCYEKVSADERKIMFESFWDMGNFSQQNAFLCGLVHHSEIKQKRPRNGSRPGKKLTYAYNLKIEARTVNVCKKFFLKTYTISNGRLSRALGKVQLGTSPGEDKRGKQKNAQKILDCQIQVVKDHINSFPAYESHYSRKDNPERKYLNPDLDVRKMYALYEEYCKERQESPVKEHYYRFIFNTKFNLHFHPPRTDTCKSCDLLKNKTLTEDDPQKIAELNTQQELHLRKAQKARQSLKLDKEMAQKEENQTYTCTIDLQKALPFPTLTVSEAYYRRFMYCYNFGVHDVVSEQAVFYVWDETVASRGSQELSSCLLKHLQSLENKRHVIIYSDACTGQNRNIKMALMLMKLLQDSTNIQVIDHKFMTSGHSYLPNDSDFGMIEKPARKKIMYVPSDWYELMRQVKKKNKFLVVKMEQEDFFSSKSLENYITKRRKDTEQKDVNWLKIQWLRYEKEKPYLILFKETLNTDIAFSAINIKPARVGRRQSFRNISLQQLYTSARPVSALKCRDMLYLLKYIPPVHHPYFQGLKSEGDVDAEALLSDSD